MTRKKKRNKAYSGGTPAETRPTVHRYKAVVRSPLGEWWHDNKKRLRIGGVIVGGVLLVVWLIIELFNVIF